MFTTSEKVTANFAQGLTGQPSAPQSGIGPDTHELNSLVCHSGELALRGDFSIVHTDNRPLALNELANAFAITGGVALQWIDAYLFLVHRRASRNELIQIAQCRIARCFQIGKREMT